MQTSIASTILLVSSFYILISGVFAGDNNGNVITASTEEASEKSFHRTETPDRVISTTIASESGRKTPASIITKTAPRSGAGTPASIIITNTASESGAVKRRVRRVTGLRTKCFPTQKNTVRGVTKLFCVSGIRVYVYTCIRAQRSTSGM